MSGLRKRTWPSGTVTWEANWYDASGRRYTANADTRREAETLHADMLRERDRGGSGDPTAGGITLAEWGERWWAGRSVRPTTAARQRSLWQLHVLPTLGDRRLAGLRRSDISAWVAGLTASDLAPSTVGLCRMVLVACLSAAVDEGLVAANPASRVSPPRVDKPERRFLAPDELVALESAMDQHWSLLVPFGAATGLRIGELAALQVRDLRLDVGEVAVRRTAIEVRGRWFATTPKSRAGVRVVPTLYGRLAVRMAEHVETRQLGPEDLVFGAPVRGPLRPSRWRMSVWRPAVELAGLAEPLPTPHPLRHTAIAAWLAAGVPVVRAAAWAGHSPAILQSTYTHLLDRQQPRAGAGAPRRAVRAGVGASDIMSICFRLLCEHARRWNSPAPEQYPEDGLAASTPRASSIPGCPAAPARRVAPAQPPLLSHETSRGPPRRLRHCSYVASSKPHRP